MPDDVTTLGAETRRATVARGLLASSYSPWWEVNGLSQEAVPKDTHLFRALEADTWWEACKN